MQEYLWGRTLSPAIDVVGLEHAERDAGILVGEEQVVNKHVALHAPRVWPVAPLAVLTNDGVLTMAGAPDGL